MAELTQWIEDKGLMVAHEPSGARRNILRTLRRHEAAESELLATRRHVEALQQVGDMGQSAEPPCLQIPNPIAPPVFMEKSLKEESASA